ncbi:MAG: UUP1 family membrane protein [Cyanobacteria bacterium J06650_10]
MKRAAYALIMALFLTALGLTIFFHKVIALDIPLLPAQSYDTWSVEARILLDDPSLFSDAQDLSVQSVDTDLVNLDLYLPQSSSRYEIVDESFKGGDFVSPSGFRSQTYQLSETDNRLVNLSAKPPLSDRVLFYRATVRADENLSGRTEQPSTLGSQIVDQQIEQARRSSAQLKDNLEENPLTESVESLIQEAKGKSDNDQAFARAIYRLSIQPNDDRVRILKETLQLGDSSVDLAAFLLNEADVVARVGNGILLNPEEAAATRFSQWLEINQGQRWFVYDPVTETFGAQTRYFTWWYGTAPVLTANKQDGIKIEVTARPDTTDGLGRSVWHEESNSFFLKHSFIGLPLSTQRVIQVLVLIPIGALVVAALHQMVGLSTFGTFTPVLIALSFRETGLLTGLILFSVIVAIGVVVRALLNRAQLLVVPRLSAVLTVTVLVIGGLALLLDDLGLRYGLSISLFPIVILAMTIERAAMMWEEDGAKETAIAAAGSLFVAVIGYLCINNVYVQHFSFVFPELLLVVLALTILLGRYNGYKLTEYFRFIALQKQLRESA